MESRPEATSTTLSLLKELPQEIQLNIFSQLNVREISRVQSTCHFYNNFLQEDTLWKAKQNERYTPTPFLDDNINQYHAAYLYYRALLCRNADQRQIKMLKLHRFIKQHHQPWSNYYRGLLHFEGSGTKVDHSTGFLNLLDSLDIEDYRAAVKIAYILIETKINDYELFHNCMQLLGDKRLHLIHSLLTKARDNYKQDYGKILGKLYAHGIGVTANFSITEAHYIRVISASRKFAADHIAELAHLKFDSLANSLNYEEKPQRTVDYLKTLKTKLPIEPLKSIINYWSAYLELARGNNDQAIALLNDTDEFPAAKIMLSHLLAERNQYRPAARHLIDIASIHVENSIAEFFDLQIQNRVSIDDCIKTTLELTGCDAIDIADRVSAYYRESMDIESLAQDPCLVWWLQLAAQTGCIHSLETLLSIKAENHPYICYALAVIYEFGILHSDTIKPNHDQSEYYFNLARNHPHLDIYVLTGQSERFACEEVMELLLSKLNSTSRNSPRKS